MRRIPLVRPAGIHHVSICVADAEAAVRGRLRDEAGLTQLERPDFGFGGHWLDAGGQQVHLMERDERRPAATTSRSVCTTSTRRWLRSAPMASR